MSEFLVSSKDSCLITGKYFPFAVHTWCNTVPLVWNTECLKEESVGFRSLDTRLVTVPAKYRSRGICQHSINTKYIVKLWIILRSYLDTSGSKCNVFICHCLWNKRGERFYFNHQTGLYSSQLIESTFKCHIYLWRVYIKDLCILLFYPRVF